MRVIRTLLLIMVLLFPTAVMAETIMMATTTSTEDSGLLDYLAPIYKADTGDDLKWVAVGTGKALEHGRNCDVDVLLVHAPEAELQYVADGYGIDRRLVMYNDFVVVGPKNDPAGIRGMNIENALKTLAQREITFVSRGDKSGTHMTEQGLWKKIGMEVPDKQKWYVEAGQGMLPTINIAAEKNGYTLTDRGTWIKYAAVQGDANPLTIVVEGDNRLFNQYSVMIVNPERCKNVKMDAAKRFVDWWVSEKTQKLINEYKLEGQQLFFANAETATGTIGEKLDAAKEGLKETYENVKENVEEKVEAIKEELK